ncbi:MAG TPA: bifunctional riboflavin kinase/FAD synthetase [Gemmatimonadaceae bacterium]|nr:bifunctional riboflavin kinase/FAD synthetase [Gemmatimonadaceae bacterium]
MADRFRGWEDSGLPPNSPGTICTVGTFDGVHRGHQLVLSRIAERADETGLHSVLVTFDPHPLEIVRPEHAPPLLTIGREKLEVVAQSGINYVAIVPFTDALRRFTAAQFVDEVLLRRFHVRQLVIGYDHHFGRGREGSADVMRELGQNRGFDVEVLGPVTATDPSPISSSRIRRAIASGKLDEAATMLGRPYSVSGTVRQGDRRGRLLGFPTINLGSPPERKLLPPNGVYAVRVHSRAGMFGGMMNLGGRPTFGDSTLSLEVHLLEAEVDLYDHHVSIEFLQYLRDIRRFEGAAELVAQLHRDAESARAALTPHGAISNLQVSP